MKSDLAGMQQDRAAIEKHLDTIQSMLANARKLVDDLLAENSKLAAELAAREAALVQMIDAVAPAPATASILTP
jgi:ABC-type transporter Mla subunit MlaD